MFHVNSELSMELSRVVFSESEERDLRNPKKNAAPSRKRTDGRRQLLVYLMPDVIRDLKVAALTDPDERPAYELAEEAIKQWLDRRRGK
jgi:hypothetical protein